MAIEVVVLRGDLCHHPRHVRPCNRGGVCHDIPVPEVLGEGGGIEEHAVHFRDRGDVPVVEGLVEGGVVIEHVVHVGDGRDVPGGEVAVEGGGAIEHARHVSHCRDVP